MIRHETGLIPHTVGGRDEIACPGTFLNTLFLSSSSDGNPPGAGVASGSGIGSGSGSGAGVGEQSGQSGSRLHVGQR